jgi:two-component system CheB/CheR fusion protein
MKNLLDSTDIATLFLDQALLVRRFTPATARIIRLLPGDIGRPITDIVSVLDYPSLAADTHEVLKTLVPVQKEVAARDQRWFTVRIMPYRTQENRVDGVVITLTEITTSKLLEAALRKARSDLQARLQAQNPAAAKAKTSRKSAKDRRAEPNGRSRS